MMGLIKEDFERCTSCSHPFFIPTQTVLVEKGSDYDNPVVLRGVTQYKCAQCGYLQYQRGGISDV
jgi:hypothetical protein